MKYKYEQKATMALRIIFAPIIPVISLIFSGACVALVYGAFMDISTRAITLRLILGIFLILLLAIIIGLIFVYTPLMIYRSFFLKSISINQDTLIIESVFKKSQIVSPQVWVIICYKDLLRYNYLLYFKKYGLVYIASEDKKEIGILLDKIKMIK